MQICLLTVKSPKARTTNPLNLVRLLKNRHLRTKLKNTMIFSTLMMSISIQMMNLFFQVPTSLESKVTCPLFCISSAIVVLMQGVRTYCNFLSYTTPITTTE
eukprot:Lithocolla_globosa_v1_NODE_1464_length_2557_cov_5.754996.p3 type:complete len:102 gc:universal NODE_1464_length_2557_cov_5.754996:2220-1915(-)